MNLLHESSSMAALSSLHCPPLPMKYDLFFPDVNLVTQLWSTTLELEKKPYKAMSSNEVHKITRNIYLPVTECTQESVSVIFLSSQHTYK